MTASRPLSGATIGVLVESEFIPDEIETYRSRFADLGARVEFISRLWGEPAQRFLSDVDQEGAEPTVLVVNIDLADRVPSDYDAVIMAANYTSVRLRHFVAEDGAPLSPEGTRTAPAVRFFAEAMKNPRVVKAALCHGLWILTPVPELLRGRRVTCHEVVLADVLNAGAVYVPPDEKNHGVVTDRDLVTGHTRHEASLLVDTVALMVLKQRGARLGEDDGVRPTFADTGMKAKHAFLEQLLADGIRTIFGNPGTTEEGFLDALTDYPQIRYVVGLQESVVVAMADGFARATKRPSVVQLHAAVGLGNAMAMLYQANRSFTPMVVVAGEPPARTTDFDGFLAGDLATLARPVTKWATRVTAPDQLPRLLRRALKVAAAPPRGPVFLALPLDVLDTTISADIVPTSFVDWSATPNPASVERVARRLLAAHEPLILIGDGVSMAGAQAEVHELADVIGAPIYGVDFGDLNASFREPLFQGLVGHTSGEETRAITGRADVVLAIGTPLFPELFPANEPYFQPGAAVIQIDLHPWEIAKNFSLFAGIQADPKLALQAVRKRLASLADDPYRAGAAGRLQQWSMHKEVGRHERDERYSKACGLTPMAPSEMMEILVGSLPHDAVVVDEGITCTDELLHYLEPSDPGRYYLGRGGCIGVGWPSAIGVSLAHPGQPVVAVSGDGSALFVLQALWTAAHFRLPVKFVVCNNHSYRILKVNLLRYWADSNLAARPFPHMDLLDPAVRFAEIGHGLGVPSEEVGDQDRLREALARAFREPGPYLVDVHVDGAVNEEAKALVRAHSGWA